MLFLFVPPVCIMDDDVAMQHECLLVVAAIRSEIESLTRYCDLVQILALLRQALQLVVEGQASGTAGVITSTAQLPASSEPVAPPRQPGSLLAEESVDSAQSQSLTPMADSMDAADSPTGARSPVGPPAADTDSSDAGDSARPLLHPPQRRQLSARVTSTRLGRSRITGGSQTSYAVHQHYIHSQDSPKGICSLEHVPKKKPEDLIRHGAGEDTAAAVQLMADVLQVKSNLETSKGELLQSVLRVADVTTTCCPENDNTQPSGFEEDDLQAWHCAAAVQHIQSLLLLSKSVQVLADYQIGQYLNYLVDGCGHEAVNALIAHLCSKATSTEVQQYRALLTNCGCTECLCDISWLDNASQRERRKPCSGTEAKTKCLHDNYKGFEPTRLRQCVKMADAVPPDQPLLFAQNVPSASRVQHLLPYLHKSIGQMERKGHRLPSSPAYLGQCKVFQVMPSEAVIAIDYVDGDGGFLVAELVPGLAEYLDTRGLATLERFSDGASTLVSFREYGHDAIELTHVYKRTDRHETKHLGVSSLRLARRLIAECDSVLVCTQGQLDAFGKRLVVEIVMKKDGTLTSNALEQLSAGLSVPLRGAPAEYVEHASQAAANQTGIFGMFPACIAKSPDMAPSSLREHFREGGTDHFEMRDGQAVCRVTNLSARRNDSHMTIYSSSLPGAGCGLFGRRQPPQRHWEEGQAASPTVVIRRHDQVCLYAKRPLAVPLDELPTVDYVLSAEVRGRERLYDASTYDGSNIGRFANDAGLLPGLKAMVRLSNKFCYPAGCEWQEVEQIAKSHANAVFQVAGPSAVVLVATKDIVLGQQSQEIFISYGIQGYWLPCIASKVSEWGVANEMVQAVMWCATSEQCNWPPNLRQQCLADMQRVQPGIDCNVPCPWPELLGSTLPPRRTRLGRLP